MLGQFGKRQPKKAVGRKRGPKPKGVVPVWSADLAYVVGIIASDGCLSGDGRHIDVTSKDREIIETVLRILGKKNVPSLKSNGSHGQAWRVQFGDVVLYNWLQSIGLTPRKSLTIGALAIPECFLRDFVRGLWDGDGTVYSYFDPRWGTYMYYIGFATASERFAVWLQRRIQRHTTCVGHTTHVRTKSGTIMHQLRYAKVESEGVFQWMFYQKGLPHLRRKFAKMKKNITLEARQVDKRFGPRAKL